MTIDELRTELANVRHRYDVKLQHFQTLHSIAKHMKFDLRDLSLKIDELEKKINKKK